MRLSSCHDELSMSSTTFLHVFLHVVEVVLHLNTFSKTFHGIQLTKLGVLRGFLVNFQNFINPDDGAGGADLRNSF